MDSIVIDRIEIVSFGKLKMIQVTPSKGINLLCAPNESGKSTLAAFIKFIFYGYTSGRMQNIIDNDKKLYTPWDNPQSAGAVYIKTESGRYKISRNYLQAGKEKLEVYETKTGKILNTGVQPGEYFFGVNEKVFERTAFFKQLTVPSAKDEFIAEQLQNIAMSADEKINTGKALKRLTEARNMLLGRAKSGLIPKLEAQRERLEIKFEESAETNKQIQELSDKIAESKKLLSKNSENLKKLKSEKENINKYETFQRIKRLKELEHNEEKAKKDYTEVSTLLNSIDLPSNSEINTLLSLNAEYKADSRTREKTYEELKKEEAELVKIQNSREMSKEQAEDLKKRADKKNVVKISFMLLSVLLALGALVGTVLDISVGGIALVWLFPAAVLAAIPAVTSALSLKKLLKENELKNIGELELILSGYPLLEQKIADKKNKTVNINNTYAELVNKTDRMKKQLEEGILKYVPIDNAMSYEEQIEYISDTAQKIKQKQTVYKTAAETKAKAFENVNMDMLEQEAFGAVKPEREKAKVDNELKFYTQQTDIFEKKEREYEGHKKYLEGKGSDPAVISGKLEAVKNRLDEYKKKHASLELAISMLSEASDYMKSTVAPRINEYAGSLFGSTTKGKYKTLSVDTSMAMSYSDKDSEKSCDYLSVGTRDSAYLCLRLALIKLLYGEAKPTLILDDAFGRLDDDRLEALLTLLSEAGKDCQTFIFTCGDREQKLLDKNGIAYTLLTLVQR